MLSEEHKQAVGLMAQQVSEAVILDVRAWNDADRIVTLFSRDYGKLQAIAYGARRPKSALAGSIQMFTYGRISVTPGRNLGIIRQCEIIEPFQPIREDLELTAYGAFVMELAGELWGDGQREEAVVDILVAVLKVLPQRHPRIIAMAAAWQLLRLAGIGPSFGNCAVCGAADCESVAFSASAGGLVCHNCALGAKQVKACTIEDVAFLQQLLLLDFAAPAHFKVQGAVLNNTGRFLLDFLAYHLERQLKSIAFINSLNIY